MTEALVRYPRLFASLIKVEHTVFALPFAYIGAFLAVDGVPRAHDLFWITVAMVGARSLAMALNRLIDAGIDARNPRTAGRELPSGQLTIAQVTVFCSAPLARSGWPASTASMRSSTSRSTGRRGCTRSRRASGSAARSPGRGSRT